MSFISEFKTFAMRGNVIDLAVGVIIGGAFQKIVDSLVKDVVMPAVGRIVGNVDFKYLYLNLGDQHYDSLQEAEKAGAPLLKYGAFINAVIDFLIIAFVIFIAVKLINRLIVERNKAEAEEEAPAAAPPESAEVQLLREIRDSLQK